MKQLLRQVNLIDCTGVTSNGVSYFASSKVLARIAIGGVKRKWAAGDGLITSLARLKTITALEIGTYSDNIDIEQVAGNYKGDSLHIWGRQRIGKGVESELSVANLPSNLEVAFVRIIGVRMDKAESIDALAGLSKVKRVEFVECSGEAFLDVEQLNKRLGSKDVDIKRLMLWPEEVLAE